MHKTPHYSTQLSNSAKISFHYSATQQKINRFSLYLSLSITMADVLILFSVLLLAAGTIPAPPPEVLPSTPPESSSTEIGCADELVAFSPCLPYISEPPNNISDSPPVQCCDNFAAAFGDDTAICLCYLVHNPEILGFPINSVKLLSLTSVCPVTEKQGQGQANFSLESLCSGETMLPPFRSVTANRRGSGSSPRRPTPPSPAPRPPGDLDIPLPQEPPGSGSLSPPPPSDVDDNHPSPDAQATKSCSAAIAIMYNCWIWVLSPMSILLYPSCKHATR
ncbi:non-specific lipid transfer protein GPI-anchored 25 [Capsicum chacoense]